MNINEQDLIVLSDDNSYVVVKKLNYENKNYYYIANVNNMENVKFLYEDGNELVEIEDDLLLEKVIVLMTEDVDMDDFLETLKMKLEEKNNINTNN